LYFIAENANHEIGASNECTTEDLAKEMKNQKVLTMIKTYLIKIMYNLHIYFSEQFI